MSLLRLHQSFLAAESGGGGASYRYYRLYITNNDGDGTYSSMSRLKLMEGTTDRALGRSGTALASSSNGGDGPGNLFDNNVGSEWVTAGGQRYPSWVSIDLGAEYTLTSYQISSQRVVTGRTPSAWTLQGSNTSQTGPWTDIDSRSGITGWGIQETKTFTL